MVGSRSNILDGRFYTKLTVLAEGSNQKIAEVTLTDATPAKGFLIKLTPKYDNQPLGGNGS